MEYIEQVAEKDITGVEVNRGSDSESARGDCGKKGSLISINNKIKVTQSGV